MIQGGEVVQKSMGHNVPFGQWGEIRETLGGPFLLLTVEAFAEWRGHPVKGEEESDYMRAGAVEGSTGVITVGREDAIVLRGLGVMRGLGVTSRHSTIEACAHEG